MTPASTVTLPVVPEAVQQTYTKHAGNPSPLYGVQLPLDKESGGADTVPGVMDTERNNLYHAKKTLLYYRLTGHGPLTGPVHLDR